MNTFLLPLSMVNVCTRLWCTGSDGVCLKYNEGPKATTQYGQAIITCMNGVRDKHYLGGRTLPRRDSVCLQYEHII